MALLRITALLFCCLPLAGCLGGIRPLKVLDFTEQRVADLSLTKKVSGRRDFLFFSTTRMSLFLEGNIQGIITDYRGNPIEGVTVKIVSDSGKTNVDAEGTEGFELAAEKAVASAVGSAFSPGLTDTMGLYKIRFSVPLTGEVVDLRGKLVYNPGWDQQRLNLGKAYEPQLKETPFRLYYSMRSGFLAFAEGIRKIIVEPVGEGKGRLQALPGAAAPGAAPSAVQPAAAPVKIEPAAQPAGSAEEDLFKGFDFGQ